MILILLALQTLVFDEGRAKAADGAAPAATNPAAAPAVAAVSTSPSPSPSPILPPFELRIKPSAETIEDKGATVIQWNPMPVEDPAGPVTVSGRFEHPEWTLLTEGGTVLKDVSAKDYDFTIDEKMTHEKFPLDLLEIGPRGEIHRLHFEAELAATQGEGVLYLVRPDDESKRISALAFTLDELPIRHPPTAESLKQSASVQVEGTFLKAGWKLFHNDTELKTEPVTGKFSFTASIFETRIVLRAEGPAPEKQLETVLLVTRKPPPNETRPTNLFSASTGYTLVTYSETGRPQYSGSNISAKVAWNRIIFPPKWDVDVNVFMSLIPLSSNLAGENVTFLGSNARVGYNFKILPEPWFTRLAVGVYYTTMFVTGDAFGYRNLLYPEIYPVLGYRLPVGVIAAYLKYVSTNAGFIPNLSEREFAGGVSYRKPIPGRPKQDMVFSVDYSDLIFIPVQDITVHTTALAISVGMTF